MCGRLHARYLAFFFGRCGVGLRAERGGQTFGRCGLGITAGRGGKANCGAASASSRHAVSCRNAAIGGGVLEKDSATTWGQLES
eukprot:9204289-Prorocentrum_lima.AAC.1